MPEYGIRYIVTTWRLSWVKLNVPFAKVNFKVTFNFFSLLQSTDKIKLKFEIIGVPVQCR